MFLPFFQALRSAQVPVSLREYLSFLEGLSAGLCTYDIEEFYYFARCAMVKDERFLDRFDRAFSTAFKGLETITPDDVLNAVDLPEDWLRREVEKHLSPEEKAQIEAMGGFEALMETLKKRLEEQKGRHQGGSKWVGTGGTSPFGAYGYNPEGVRIGQDKSRHQRAIKVWGQARISRFRRKCRAGHAQHQAGAETAAAMGASRGAGRAGPARHDPRQRRGRIY